MDGGSGSSNVSEASAFFRSLLNIPTRQTLTLLEGLFESLVASRGRLPTPDPGAL